MKEINDVYPVTIIDDRYAGCYSGGKYLAFNLEAWDVPKGVSWGGDVDCAGFWADEASNYVIGKGNTPDRAYQDLVERVKITERELKKENPHLDPKKTFQDFIEGESNKFARRIGLSIAESLDMYNTFFIYGPSGCGKTHLVNAMGLRYKELNPLKTVLYVTARQFQNEFTDSVRKNTTSKFINFYQSVDMLIVDDIQEWMKAPKTAETFFHIFNNQVGCGKQIILACDRPPVDLNGMEKRLLTHFSSGVVTELEMPNEQLYIDILNAKCKQDNIKIPAEVLNFIAKKAKSVCDIEGIVNSLKAYSIVQDTIIDLNLAERLIKNIVV